MTLRYSMSVHILNYSIVSYNPLLPHPSTYSACIAIEHITFENVAKSTFLSYVFKRVCNCNALFYKCNFS